MLSLSMTSEQIDTEINHIVGFISNQLSNGEKAVIGVSGGLDSDVVTRLTAEAIGVNRLKLFTVVQEAMEARHLANARELATKINVDLVEINLTEFSSAFINAMQKADSYEQFQPDGLLDPSRAKCSIRTVVFSTYQDRGYVVVGTSNRTELETGFFLPFGDGLAHIKPIIHLYKTQVRQLAKALGTSNTVLDQPASAGFWQGQEDIEDLAYWLYNEAPIGREIEFDDLAEIEVTKIRSHLTTENVDFVLLCLARGMDDASIEKESGAPVTVVARMRKLTTAARKFKHRPMNVRMDNLS